MNKKLINVLNIALVCIVLVMVVVLYYTGKKEHFLGFIRGRDGNKDMIPNLDTDSGRHRGRDITNRNFVKYANYWFQTMNYEKKLLNLDKLNYENKNKDY